jgi:hypothetical protein
VKVLHPPSVNQLSRLDYYRGRVKILEITRRSMESFPVQTSYQILSEAHRSPIFPNLQSLKWLWTVDFGRSFLFMHTNVSTFTLCMPYTETTSNDSTILFQLVEHMPFLTVFELGQNVSSDTTGVSQFRWGLNFGLNENLYFKYRLLQSGH